MGGLNIQGGDYFLAVGTIEPRKNLELLVRVGAADKVRSMRA